MDPFGPTLTRIVVESERSRTKMSDVPFVSAAIRFEATLWNATKRPSAEIDARKLSPFPPRPIGVTLTRVVRPSIRSRTNTSSATFVSKRTSFVAAL